MNQDPLDPLLGDYAQHSLPRCPLDLQAGVWREIERRRHDTLAARLGWNELFQRPAWTLAGLVIALAVGAVPAMAFGHAQSTKQLARDSLHFEVFSPLARGQIASVFTRPDVAVPSSP